MGGVSIFLPQLFFEPNHGGVSRGTFAFDDGQRNRALARSSWSTFIAAAPWWGGVGGLHRASAASRLRLGVPEDGIAAHSGRSWGQP